MLALLFKTPILDDSSELDTPHVSHKNQIDVDLLNRYISGHTTNRGIELKRVLYGIVASKWVILIKEEAFMDKFKEIRPVVLGIAIRNNKLLVSEGFDNIKNENFYRCLGGGIEFLEKSDEALKREFLEEINVNIVVKNFLGISENIFTYQGKKAHELILFYLIEISDENYMDEYVVMDDHGETVAKWIDIDEFKNKSRILYPEEVFKYIWFVLEL